MRLGLEVAAALAAGVERLRGLAAGRATLLDLSTIAAGTPPPIPTGNGVVGRASDLVRCPEKCRPLVERLLGAVVVVESHSDAMRLAARSEGGLRFVSLDGEVWERGRVRAGGSRAGGLLHRETEIRELTGRLADLLLQVEGQDRVFGMGDATNLPISKSGSTAHFEAPVVASRITSLIRGSRGNYREVEAPSDYINRYGRYDANTTLWLNVNLSPHFPSVAEVARNLYLRSNDIEVSAVVGVDLVSVGYLVEALGGMDVDGERLRGPELATDFLIDSYLRFPDSDAQDEYLAGVAREAFHQALTAEDRDGRAIVGALRRSVEERRLALVTWLPEVDKLLAEIGADGALLPGDPGDLELVVQNFASNKIDLFTQQIFSVDVTPSGCTVHGEVEVRLANQAPSWAVDLPASQRWGITGQWWVNIHLPRAAELEALLVEGEPGVGTLEEEQGRPVVATLVAAEPGEEVTITVRWKEPIEDSNYVLTLQPQPLVRPAILEFGSTEEIRFANTEQHRISTGCMVEAEAA